MRKLLSLLMFVVLTFGGSWPAMVQAHAGNDLAVAEISSAIDATDSAEHLKCCQTTKSDSDQHRGNCAMHCPYLPVFMSLPAVPVSVTASSSVQPGRVWQLVYFPIRPPISI